MSSDNDEKFPFSSFFNFPSENTDEEQLGLSFKPKPVAKKELSPISAGDLDSSELESIKKGINSYLEELIPPQKYSAYFDQSFALVTLNNGTATFSVATEFIKGIIEHQYLNAIEEGIVSVLGKKYKAQIVVNGQMIASLSSNSQSILRSIKSSSNFDAAIDTGLHSTPEQVEDRAEARYLEHMNENQVGSSIDPKKTFENFIIGPSNHLAFATAKAASENPGKRDKHPSLYYYSNSGLGKTHLLHAIGNQIKLNFPQKVICLTNANQFTNEMVDAIRSNHFPEFRRKYTDQIDVLMIDDIHVIKKKERTQEELFNIFNTLHEKQKQLIFTSDKKPEDIEGLEERLKTRLQWGLVVDIQAPDLETRIAILKQKAMELDMFLPNDVIELIASSIRSNIRELEGALLRLSMYSYHMNCEIDLMMAKNYLDLSVDNRDKAKITLEVIGQAAAEHFGVELADLKSPSRVKEISMVRQVAMYLSKKLIDATNQEIATYYNRKDHTTVMHGVKSINIKIKEDPILARDIATIESKL